jgi:hypothetical protein
MSALAHAAQSIVISRCGETVAPGSTAYLAQDLDCRGSASAGVILSHRSRLVLGGYNIIGDPGETDADGAPLQGVRCETGSVCTLEGPGAIAGFSASGVAGTRVRLRDVLIADNAVAGISAFENVRLRGVVISDNGTLAVHAGGRVHATDADLGDERAAVVEWHAPQFKPGDGAGS